MISLAFWFISKSFNVNYHRLFRHLWMIAVSLVSMYGSFVILRFVGLDLACASKVTTFIELAIYGIVGACAYFMTSCVFRLPQQIFKMSLTQLFSKITRRLKR